MAGIVNQGWEADDEDSLHSVHQEMKSFLLLDSPTRSSFSLPTSDYIHAHDCCASFLSLDSAPDAVTVMDVQRSSTMEKPESITSESSNSLATIPASVRTVTTCNSSSSSTRSQNQHNLLPNACRQFRRVRARSSFTDGSDNEQTRLDSDFLDHLTPSSPKPRSQSTNRSGSPIQTGKSLPSSADRRGPRTSGVPSVFPPTKDEFEALPATIQRKYFSTAERLRITYNPEHRGDEDSFGHRTPDSQSPSATLFSDEEDGRPPLRLGFGQDELENAPHRRCQSKPLRIYASPENRLRRNRYISYDQLKLHRPRQSPILDATEESSLRVGTRHIPPRRLSTSWTNPEPRSGKMVSFTGDGTAVGSDLKNTADSMYESFRWLEEDEDLDLRLGLDDYNANSRGEDVLPPSKHRQSFRRHLSISKLPFGSRASTTLSRPNTKDIPASPQSPNASLPGSPMHGHIRRKSRALSLISPQKQSVPDTCGLIDSAAAHYQDPDARMKLRVYLASPHKFDEAVEFGFPSIEEVSSNDKPMYGGSSSQPPRSTSALGKSHDLIEDDKSSLYSDEASSEEPESPRTPELMEKPTAAKTTRTSHDGDATPSRADFSPAPATSREMTLRMTLTRSDLRADEDQIYGWQKVSNGRKSYARDEPLSPVSVTTPREAHSKESIERQFAAMDQEDMLANDSGVVKRFWNRVRRNYSQHTMPSLAHDSSI